MVIRTLFLLPCIALVRLSARLDPHLWRWWDVKSLESWKTLRVTWVAWALALAGWALLFAAVGSLLWLLR